MQTITQIMEAAKQRAINSEACRAAGEIESLLDELTLLVGVDRMTDLMREGGYNIEPSPKARNRVFGNVVHS